MNNCETCNKETLNPKYCTRSCAAISNGKKYPKRIKTKTCKTCNVLISANRAYCSKKCYPKKSKKLLIGYPKIKEYRKRIKLESIKYKGNCCKNCGYSKCIDALEFHHIDPSEKEFSISGGIKSWDRVKIELDKCVLVCSNCHREIHAGLLKIK